MPAAYVLFHLACVLTLPNLQLDYLSFHLYGLHLEINSYIHQNIL